MMVITWGILLLLFGILYRYLIGGEYHVVKALVLRGVISILFGTMQYVTRPPEVALQWAIEITVISFILFLFNLIGQVIGVFIAKIKTQ